jgi:hypothetical protein
MSLPQVLLLGDVGIQSNANDGGKGYQCLQGMESLHLWK